MELLAIGSADRYIELCSAFAHGFHPFRKRGGRVVYLVHRHSSIARRSSLAGRYLRYREVVGRLKDLGCSLIREGKGSHEIWRGPNLRTFSVPRYPGDLRVGTIAAILKQAALLRRCPQVCNREELKNSPSSKRCYGLSIPPWRDGAHRAKVAHRSSSYQQVVPTTRVCAPVGPNAITRTPWPSGWR